MKKIKPAVIFYGIFGFLVVQGINTYKLYSVTSPQKVTLSLRQLQAVAQNRASLRLMPEIDYSDQPGVEESVSDSPVVDVKCGDNLKELHSVKLTKEFSEPVCGIRIRLLNPINKDSYYGKRRATVEIVW